MQRQTANDFDHASLEAMMERYRAELLRYQRATPPGKPTLAQNLETSEKGRMDRISTVVEQKPATPPKAEIKPPTAQTVNTRKAVVQPEVRRDKVLVDTPPIMLLTPRFDVSNNNEDQVIMAPPTPDLEIEAEISAAPVQLALPSVLPVPPFLKLPLTAANDIATENIQVPQESTQLQSEASNAANSEPEVLLQPEEDGSDQAPAQQSLIDGDAEQSPQIVAPQSKACNAENGELEVLLKAEKDRSDQAPVQQAVIDNKPEPIPQIVVPPPVAAVPPMHKSYVLPAQPPEPIINSKSFAPVKKEGHGCIAHTEFEKCAGAYGVFRPYERMGKYTLASFLQTPGEAIQTLVRFAADVPMGSADAIRCRRSFTVKFFCREGEYDLFGMHLPVSVGTTENTLNDCCATLRANPKTGLRTSAAFWEFLVTHPEALHATLWLYSDLGTIGSYRTIDGYGLPCIWVNAKNERRAVRPRWLSRQRPQTLTRFEAEELAGSDPDAVARDLVNGLQAGERPQYELSIQVIEPDQFASLSFDPFDPTAIWPAEQFKPQRIGLLTLERLPDDVQIELSCDRFQPENIIPGIEHVPAPPQKSGDDFTQVQQYLRSLGEFSRHRLVDNLTEELLRLPPLLLEQVLILFSRADLEFGQALTLALGG